jgi:signal transduction histidine kinase
MLNLDGSYRMYKVHRFPLFFYEETYVGGWAVDINQENKLQKKLIEQEKRNKRKIIKSALEVQEKERQELSAELHDNVNQILTSCKLLLEASQVKRDMIDQLIHKCNHSLQQAITEIRRISHTLNPSSINDIGLIAAINEMLERINITGKVHFTFEYNLSQCIDMLKHEDQVAIYRTIQESVSNIIKHSKAKNAMIRICSDASGVLLIIKDDGIGLDIEKVKKGLGLKTINNRVQYYNGKLKLDSSLGKGCIMKIFFNMPVHVKVGSYMI